MAERWAGEDGNTLALFPAAVMVMFLLASIAIDAAVTFSAQRRLADIAAAAANDAASAFADEVYFGEGAIVIDAQQAQERVASTLASRSDADHIDAACTATTADAGARVVVDCTGEVRQLISPMRFLGVTSRDIQARASAIPAEG